MPKKTCNLHPAASGSSYWYEKIMEDTEHTIRSFVAQWPDTSQSSREHFTAFWQALSGLPAVRLEFHSRPGVSYSLRGVHDRPGARPLFVMVDVIDDEPRWLSVCFYGQSVTDPEQRGDFVPGGLLGEDGLCFDLDESNGDLLAYVKDRITEAYNAV